MKLTKLDDLQYIIQLDDPAEEAELLSLVKTDDLLKSHEVCAMLKISRMTLTNYVRAGLIETVSLTGKSYRYKKSSVMKLLNNKS